MIAISRPHNPVNKLVAGRRTFSSQAAESITGWVLRVSTWCRSRRFRPPSGCSEVVATRLYAGIPRVYIHMFPNRFEAAKGAIRYDIYCPCGFVTYAAPYVVEALPMRIALYAVTGITVQPGGSSAVEEDCDVGIVIYRGYS